MNPIRLAQVLPQGRDTTLSTEDNCLMLRVDGETRARFHIDNASDNTWALHLTEAHPVASWAEPWLIGVVLGGLFDSLPDLKQVVIALGERQDLAESLYRHGYALGLAQADGRVLCPRGLVRQRPELWLAQTHPTPFPLHQTVTDGKRHPLRPPIFRGEVYGRFIAALDSRVSFRTIDADRDLEVFHRWMNNPRVSHFWELEGSRDDHARYICKVLADAHMHPVVGCFDGQPFGYFEIYWAKEDRIAPYYAVDDYDRGIHMLVGEETLRGPHRVAAWLPSLAHFLFLDDPRTRHVVAEPRADNAKMIGYMQRAGFHKAKEFNFPHKRAALMVVSREVFFDQFCP